MNLNKSFVGFELADALKFILEQTKDDLRPVIIVRKDDPDKLIGIRKFLKSDIDCIYVKLGVANSMDKIFEMINQQISGNLDYFGDEFEQMVPVLVSRIKAMANSPLIVIDNCQYFIFGQIFSLLGLMLELSGHTQFIFLLPEDYETIWDKSKPEYNTSLFLNYVQLKFEVSGCPIVTC